MIFYSWLFKKGLVKLFWILLQPPTEEKKDIGQFPYNRGETPIFNFDIGDEPFIEVT